MEMKETRRSTPSMIPQKRRIMQYWRTMLFPPKRREGQMPGSTIKALHPSTILAFSSCESHPASPNSDGKDIACSSISHHSVFWRGSRRHAFDRHTALSEFRHYALDASVLGLHAAARLPHHFRTTTITTTSSSSVSCELWSSQYGRRRGW